MRRALVVGVAVGTLILSACSTVVAGTGSGSPPAGTGSRGDFPTGARTAGPSSSADATPTPSAGGPTGTGTSTRTPGGATAIGNPRTADLCPALVPSAFARYGRPGGTYRATPVECDFVIPKGNAAVHLSAYVTGSTTTSTSGPSRTVAGLDIYDFAYVASDRHCRATVVATGVAVTVNANDQSNTEKPAVLCAMRDRLATQVAQAITAGKITQTRYGSNSLTSVQLCDYVDGAPVSHAPLAAGLVTQQYALGNECDLSNSVYNIYVYVGLEQAPVYVHEGGREIRTGGHTLYLMYGTSSTKTYCRLVSPQSEVPDTGSTETLEASVELAPRAPSAAASGSNLCSRILSPLLVSALDRMKRK